MRGLTAGIEHFSALTLLGGPPRGEAFAYELAGRGLLSPRVAPSAERSPG
jgi:hypothetical protein